MELSRLALELNKTFFSINNDRVVFRDIHEGQFGLFMNIRLDESTTKYLFRVYSLADVIGQIGGSIGFLHAFLTVLLSHLVYRLWTIDLLNKVYQIHYDPDIRDCQSIDMENAATNKLTLNTGFRLTRPVIQIYRDSDYGRVKLFIPIFRWWRGRKH
jgi:hypothetical protein